MRPLHGTSATDALRRFWHFFWAPAWVSFVLALVSHVVSERAQAILINAVMGQLAVTLLKLLFYVALCLLGTAVLLKGIPYVATALKWSGANIADVTFDYASCAVGVFVGIGPTVTAELGFRGGFGVSVYLIVLLIGLQGSLWAASNLAYGHFDAAFHRHASYPRAFARLLGVGLLALGITSSMKEPWNEVPKECATTTAECVHAR